LKLFKVILGLGVVGAGFISYLFYSKPTPALQYFADIHIGPPQNTSQVEVHIIFDRVPELDSPPGLAHYTEHLVAMNALIDDFNAADRHANAYTSSTTVGYWVSGAKDQLPVILENLGGVFDPISLDIRFANEEVDIVRREYDMRSINNLDHAVYMAMTPFLYEGNAVGGLSYSTPASIAMLDYDQAVTYYEATHQQRSAVLLVLGDVSKKEVQKALKGSSIKPLKEPTAIVAPAPFNLAKPDKEQFRFRRKTAEPRIIFRKIVTLDKAIDFDFLQLQTAQLHAVLDSNLPGGIAGPLRYDNFLASSFELALIPVDEQNIEIWFEANPDTGVSFEQLQLVFENTLKAAGNGIPVSTYERVQARSEQYWVDWEDEKAITDWMSTYVKARVMNLRSPANVTELEKMAEQVSLEHINDLLAALQKPGRQAVAHIGIDSGEYQ